MIETKIETERVYLNWFAVAFSTTFIGICTAMVYFKIPSIMPLIIEEYNINLNQASMLMNVFMIVPLILGIPTGLLCRRIGPRNLYILATIALVAGSIIGAITNSSDILVFSRGLEGVAMIFGMIAGPVAIQTLVAPEDRGKAIGLVGTNISIGSFLAGAMTPTVTEKLGISGLWLVYAGLCVIALVIILLCYKREALQQKPKRDSVQNSEDVIQEEEVKATMLFKPFIFLFLIGYTIWNLGILAVLTYAPTFMQGEGLSPTLAGTLSSLPNLLAVIICPIFGMLADRTHKLKLLLIITCLAVAPGSFILVTTTKWPLWIGIIILALGMAAPTMNMIIFPQLLPSRKLLGLGMGFLSVSSNLGMLLGSAIPAQLLTRTNENWFALGLTLFVLTLIGTGCYMLVNMKHLDSGSSGQDPSTNKKSTPAEV